MNNRSRHIAIALLAATAGLAAAQVTMYDVDFHGYANQTSAAAPVGSSSYYLSLNAYATTGLDFFYCTLQPPTSTPPRSCWADYAGGFSYFDGPYASQATLLSTYPNGTYQLDLYGGFSASQSFQFSRTSAWWPSVQPAFTPSTYASMQAFDAAQPFVCTFNAFAAPYPADSALTILTVTDLFDNSSAYYAYVVQPATRITIPASRLQAGHPYQFQLTHSSRLNGYDLTHTPNPSTLVRFSLSTTANATALPPAPCFADFNLDGGVDGSDLQAFFETWSSGVNEADVNLDGGVDGADVETFILQWQAGGC